MAIKDYVETQAEGFKRLVSQYRLAVDRFIRTTDADHQEVVNDIWDRLVGKGYIKKELYKGWYCVREETFFQERDLVKTKDGSWNTEEGDAVERVEEENYILKMKDFLDNQKFESQDQNIYPSKQKSRLKDLPSRDVSISRPITRVQWGIKLRNDSSNVIYVWFDALINYITLLRHFGFINKDLSSNQNLSRPVLINILGKDILRFHSVMLPSISSMSGIDFEHHLVCHDHWLKDGRKMSKSYGNVVDPEYLLSLGPRAIE